MKSYHNIIPQLLGETGRVLQVLSNGDIMLAIKGRTWVFNALCLTPAEEKVTTKSPSMCNELYNMYNKGKVLCGIYARVCEECM